MLKLLTGIVLALALQSSYAVDLSVGDDGILENLPRCEANGKVAHYIADKKTLHRFSFGFAMAYVDGTGEKVILYDPVAMADSHPAFQYWMLRHECAHHTQGHTTSRVGLYSKNEFRFSPEDEADCVAAKEMVENGMSQDDIDATIATIKDRDHIKKHFPPHIRLWNFIPTARANLVERCVLTQQGRL